MQYLTISIVISVLVGFIGILYALRRRSSVSTKTKTETKIQVEDTKTENTETTQKDTKKEKTPSTEQKPKTTGNEKDVDSKVDTNEKEPDPLHEQEVGETLDVSYPGDKGGVIKTVLTKGNGPMPKFGQEVEVHYEGFLENGDKFDSSRDRDQRFKFILGAGEVIQGWDCCVGKKR